MSSVQTWLARKYVVKIEKLIGGAIHIGQVKVRLPHQILIDDLIIWDQLGDTLLAVNKVQIGINKYDLKDKKFKFGLVKLEDPFLYLQEDPGGGLNLSFILETLKPKNGDLMVPEIKINRIVLENGRFRFHEFRALRQTDTFSTDYMEYNEVNLSASDFQLDAEKISLRVRSLNASEMSGIQIKDFHAMVLLKDKTWFVEDFEMATAHSQISIPELNLKLNHEGDTTGINRFKITGQLANTSKLSEIDVQYFLPEFRGEKDIYFSGDFDLINSSFNWSGASLDYEDLANFQGDIKVTGIENWRTADYSLQVDTLWYAIKAHDSSLPGLFVQTDTLDLPFDLDSLGGMGFKGVFIGNQNAFSTQGAFTSSAGNIYANINSTEAENPNFHNINGSIKGTLNHFDNFLGTTSGIGNLQFYGDFYGSIKDFESFDLDLDFEVPQIFFHEYNYKNVILKGKALNKTFDGILLVQDENIEMDLETIVNFQKSIPSFDLELSLANAHLNALNISKLDSLEILDLNLHGSFKGTNIENLEGQIWVTNSFYENSRGRLPIQEIALTIGPELGKRKINVVSDYIDARIFGDIHLDGFLSQLQGISQRFLPLSDVPISPEEGHLNDFTFNIQLKNPKPLTEILTPKIIFKDNTQVNGFIKRGGLEWEFEGFSPQYAIAEKQFTDFAFRVVAANDSVQLTSSLSKLQINKYTKFDQIQFTFLLTPDLLTTSLSWENRDALITKGSIYPEIRFASGKGKWPQAILHVPQTEIVYKDSVWNINQFGMILDKSLFRFDSLRLQHGAEKLLVNGSISDLPLDTLYVEFQDMNLDHINIFKGEKGKFNLAGIVDGEARLFDLHQRGLFLADLNISDFTVNNELLGNTQIQSNRHAGEDNIYMEILTTRGDISTLGMKGMFNPTTDEIDFKLSLDKLRMNLFNGVLDKVFRDIRGIASGQVDIKGTRSDPQINGDIFLQKASFFVDYLNTKYTFTHPVKVTPNGFLIDNLIARDKDGNEAIVNGGIQHNKFKDLNLDLKLNVTNFLCLNTTESTGESFWGQAYATGLAEITGPPKNIKIVVKATTEQGTDFSLPVSKKGKIRKVDFITFIKKDTAFVDPDLVSYDELPLKNGSDVDLSGLELSFDIDVNPSARVQIIIDSQTGDVIRAKGRGNLNIDVNTRGSFEISGDYLINEGDYQFTLQNMPLKRFEIEPGGRVTLNGPIGQAQIDLDAIYSTKAALYDLVLDETNTDLRQRIPVECHLLMNGLLGNPELKFDIVLPPNSDDIARSQLSSLSQDEMNKQILSLLILNQFSPLPGVTSSTPRSFENAGLATTTEVLSNQLNYLLSQISNDFDIGFNYRPGDELTSDEVAVALKAQLLGDRMTINVNGNVDVRSVETDANQLVGDVQIDYKITPSGKLQVKAFTRANDRLLYEYSQYTQGFGVFFREEFDSFGGLLKKYWDGIFKKSNQILN